MLGRAVSPHSRLEQPDAEKRLENTLAVSIVRTTRTGLNGRERCRPRITVFRPRAPFLDRQQGTLEPQLSSAGGASCSLYPCGRRPLSKRLKGLWNHDHPGTAAISCRHRWGIWKHGLTLWATAAKLTNPTNQGRNPIVKKYLMSCVALALATLPLAAKAQDTKLDRAGITVGTLGNPFFVPLIKGAEDGLKEGNPKVEVTVVGADYDLNKQASQLDSFIGTNAKIIMLNAVDAVAVKPFVDKAKAAGIIVAAMDVSAGGADLTVMTNNVQAGELACEDLAKRLNGKGDVVIINGPPVSSIIDRVKGCKQAFAKYPEINILSDNQDGKASRDGGLAVMQALLTRFPKIDGVFGANDPTAIGAELAAKQLNRGEMIIAGVDGSPDFVTALKREGSRLVSSSAQDPYGMAKMAAEKAVALMHGVKPEPATILLDTKLVTKENVDTYPGWDGGR